jgi:hypothetical protein
MRGRDTTQLLCSSFPAAQIGEDQVKTGGESLEKSTPALAESGDTLRPGAAAFGVFPSGR